MQTARGPVTARRGVLVAVDGRLEHAGARARRAGAVGPAADAGHRPADDVAVARPVYARYGLDYWQQLPDGRIALGGGRDVGGEAEWATTPGTSAPVQAPPRAAAARASARRPPVEHRWAGVVGFTTDALPVLAEPEPGLLAVGGYSGTGNLVGPLCATWAANRLLGLPDLLASC